MNFEINFQPTNESEIDEAERYLQLRLPSDYRFFLLELNGGKRPSRGVLSYKEIDGRTNETLIDTFFGIGHTTKYNIQDIYDFYESNRRISSSTLPIASDIAGNLVCFDFKKSTNGKLYFWDHELECAPNEDGNLILLADSFSELLSKLKKDEG